MISKSFKDWGLRIEFWVILLLSCTPYCGIQEFPGFNKQFLSISYQPFNILCQRNWKQTEAKSVNKKNKQTKRGQIRILWTIELINIKSHLLDDLVQFRYSLNLSASSNLFCNPSRKSSMTWRCKIKRANWSNTIKHYVE